MASPGTKHTGELAPGSRPVPAAAGSAGADLDEAGEFLTTAQGLRLPDTDHSLKAGERGPILMEGFGVRTFRLVNKAVGLHRAWDRAPAVMASAVPPVPTS